MITHMRGILAVALRRSEFDAAPGQKVAIEARLALAYGWIQ